MCAFGGYIFLALMLALWWLGSLFQRGPNSPKAQAAPLASHSFDAEHLLGYGAILFVSGFTLVQMYEKAWSARKGLPQLDDQQPDFEPLATDLKHRGRGWIAGGVIIAACTAIFFLWSSDHEVPPPLSVTCRGSYIGKGRVMIITNTSNAPMYEIRVKVDSSDGTGEQVADVLTSLGSKEVGWHQLRGGKLMTGQTTYVYAKGYSAPVVAQIY